MVSYGKYEIRCDGNEYIVIFDDKVYGRYDTAMEAMFAAMGFYYEDERG